MAEPCSACPQSTWYPAGSSSSGSSSCTPSECFSEDGASSPSSRCSARSAPLHESSACSHAATEKASKVSDTLSRESTRESFQERRRDLALDEKAPDHLSKGAERAGASTSVERFGRPQESSTKENARPDEAPAAQEVARQTLRRDRHWLLPQRYEAQDLIGSGFYGSVREAYDREKQRRVAIRRTPHLFRDLGECSSILGDIAILSRLNHESIVRVFDVITPQGSNSLDEVYMVMEVCDSDMNRLLHTNVALEHAHINTLLYNLTLGLNYLHSAGICHMDLRPANCLMNQDCSVKIRDFSFACSFDEESQPQVPATNQRNSRSYQAPELMLPYARYTEAIDVWSLGCIYAELLQMLPGFDFARRRPLFRRSSASQHASHDRLGMIFHVLGTPTQTEIEAVESEEARRYLKRYARTLQTNVRDGLQSQFSFAESQSVEILEQFLRFMPQQRIAMAGALQHRVFAGIRDEAREVCPSQRIKLPFAIGQDLDEPFLRKQLSKALQTYHPSCL